MTGPGRDDWYLASDAGIRVARCRLLDDCHRFGHGFSTRDRGGVESAEAVLAAAGLAGREVRMLRQVHGSRLVVPGAGYPQPEADGFLLDAGEPTPAAGIRTADCVPVLLVNPVSGHGAAIHSGWRGTAAGIVPLAVAILAGWGARPGDFTAALGPAIGGCCYRVGPEVVRAMGGAGVLAQPGPARIDLRQAIRLQLEAAGVPACRISIAPWCTFCEESQYFSWRREGGTAGRMLSVLGTA